MRRRLLEAVLVWVYDRWARERSEEALEEQKHRIEERRQKRSQLSPTGAKVWGDQREEGEDEH